MGYKIFATGVLKPHSGSAIRFPSVDKKNRPWGDEWEMNKMLDLGLSMKGVNTGGTISGGATVSMMKELAMMQYKRLMGSSLQILALEAEGQLSIFTKNTGLTGMFPESNYKTFNFQRHNIDSEYRQLLQHLKKVELNKMGPMIDILTTLSNWSVKSKPGRYIMNFDFEW